MTAARSDLKPGQILGIEPSIDRDLAERQLPQTFQDELKALRLAASQPDREALKEFIVSASFASRAALDSDTIFCEIYTPGYSPAKKGSFGFFVKELRAILSLLSGMSLRDWFAGQAVVACIQKCVPQECDTGENMEQMFARKAFLVADAMLAARAAAKGAK